MDLEQQYKALKASLDSKRQEQLQIQAELSAIESQLTDLQSEASALGILDLTQLDSIIQSKSSDLQSKLSDLQSKLNGSSVASATPVVSQVAPAISVASSVAPVTDPTPTADFSAFGDFGL